MQQLYNHYLAKTFLLTMVAFFVFLSCDRTSSPEGRMSIKLEDQHRELLDSLRQQNRAILDSLSNIRKEINELRGTGK